MFQGGEPDLRFADRRDAGRRLAEALRARQREGALPDPVVLALPRGGLPVADEVAAALDAPLDVLVVRKIGAPFQPEMGVGALAGEDEPVYDRDAMRQLGLDEADLAPVVRAEREELRRRRERYRGDRPERDLTGHTAIVVDDGMATGSTARAALRRARRLAAARLVLAVPVAAADAGRALEREADEVVCLHRPSLFGAVGFWYEDFEQLGDDEVLRILRRYA